jgi:glycosyltransferase involved in cell wall biosynthesis
MLKPAVSVVMPIYNNTQEEFLREAISSILSQTFTDFEFLILNDSPDNTKLDNIVKSFHDKRIRYYKNKKNLGISGSRNKLIELAKGEFLAIFDHDDISLPDRLEKQVEFLNAHPEIGVCG